MENSLERLPKWLMQKYPRELLPCLWKLIVVIPAKVIWSDLKYLIKFRLFGKNPFSNVITTGTMAGNDGRKMSKSLGNFTDPNELMDKFSADSL